MSTLYRNARVFTADVDPGHAWAEAFTVDDDRIGWVGADADAPAADQEVDLDGRLVLPGFVDAHTHLLMMGEALGQIPLTHARSIEEIQHALLDARSAAPHATSLIGRGWLFDAVPGGRPLAALIDEVVSDIPVYLDANDYHSCWLNSAALAEVGITRDTPDPHGGSIVRDGNGEATGLVLETAATQYVWAHRESVATDEARDRALQRAIDGYLESGVTGVVDMMLDEYGLATLDRAQERHGGELPLRVAAHWFVGNLDDPEATLAQVRRAAELAARPSTPWVRVVGIKLVLDGVIDACTAAMNRPYADGSSAAPIWSLADLEPVVAAADAAGLQIALHAIGDHAIDIALDAIEHAATVNGNRNRRHRIEHLEYAAPGTAERMARLGVTASMQPVHSDPAIFANWAEMLGDERVDRAFAWPEYEDAGALLAFSTDAPTAPHEALANMYVAATRASALNPELPAVHPQFALPLERAIGHATRDAAASVGDGGWRGRIAPGFAADLIVLDVDPFRAGNAALLEARVLETIVAGRTRYRRP